MFELTGIKVQKFKLITIHSLINYAAFKLICPDSSFKYLSFGTNIMILGAIEAEIQSFDRFGSKLFGQCSTTRISETGRPNPKKNWDYFFFTECCNCAKFYGNRSRWGSDDCVDLVWNDPYASWILKLKVKHC